MNEPIRHHWWPQLNSKLWKAEDGLIKFMNSKGIIKKSQPINIGIVKNLYSFYDENDKINNKVERILSKIDGKMAEFIINFNNKKIEDRIFYRENYLQFKELGYKVEKGIDIIKLSRKEISIISLYIASMLVRTPKNLYNLGLKYIDHKNPKAESLTEMLTLCLKYYNHIKNGEICFLKKDASNEFIFTDGGPIMDQPFSQYSDLPFTIHFPLSPEICIQFIAAPKLYKAKSYIVKCSNTAIANHNRLIMSGAKDFVYGRSKIPIDFCMKHWGKSPPKFMITNIYNDGFISSNLDFEAYKNRNL